MSLLARWYAVAARELPWRQDPANAYAVLVSEIMLQQTQVVTVLPRYARWMDRWPTAASLALADEAEVLAEWEGLGYYSRARSLWRCAQTMDERWRGTLPNDPVALRALPGVGDYTAGAVLSIVHGRPVPAVDGNAVRVIARMAGLRGRDGLLGRVRRYAARLVCAGSPATTNQAVMELGATVCTPARPQCGECPVASVCIARAEGSVEQIPARPVRRTARPVVHVAAMAVRSGALFVVQSPHPTLWRGLWSLPLVETDVGADCELAAANLIGRVFGGRARPGVVLAEVRHAATTLIIRHRVVMVEGADSGALIEGCWVGEADRGRMPMASSHRRAMALALGAHGERV